MKGIKVYSNEGPHPFLKGDNSENTLTEILKSSPDQMGQFQPNLILKSFLGKGDSGLFK